MSSFKNKFKVEFPKELWLHDELWLHAETVEKLYILGGTLFNF